MELLLFVGLLVLIVALVGGGTAAQAPVVMGGDSVSKGMGCVSILLAAFLIGLIALWLFAALGGGVIGPVEVRPDTAPAGAPVRDYQPCTKAEHGRLTGDGKWLCIENGHNPGQFYWRPWPER